MTEMADSMRGVDSQHPAVKEVSTEEDKVVLTVQGRTAESSGRNTAC